MSFGIIYQEEFTSIKLSVFCCGEAIPNKMVFLKISQGSLENTLKSLLFNKVAGPTTLIKETPTQVFLKNIFFQNTSRRLILDSDVGKTFLIAISRPLFLYIHNNFPEEYFKHGKNEIVSHFQKISLFKQASVSHFQIEKLFMESQMTSLLPFLNEMVI